MMGRGPLDVEQLTDRRVFEPRELLELHEHFFGVEEKPEPVTRDIRHFNGGSAFSRLRGFHLHAPELVGGPLRATAD